MNDEQMVTIENGGWFFDGFRMGPADEECVNQFGYSSEYTVEEALALGLLDVDERTGTPVCDA